MSATQVMRAWGCTVRLGPADHSWLVATEIDLDSTLVGGSGDLVENLVESGELEALSIDLDAPYEDEINI